MKRKTESNRLSAIITRKNELRLVCDRVKKASESSTDDSAYTGVVSDDVNQAMMLVLEAEMTLLEVEADEIRRRQGQHIDADNLDGGEEAEEEVKQSPVSLIGDSAVVLPMIDEVSAEEKQILLEIAEHQQKQNEAAACEDYELAATIEEIIVTKKKQLQEQQKMTQNML